MVRLNATKRRQMIIDAGVIVAGQKSVDEITSENVAEACRVETSVGTVRRYFLTIDQLREEVTRELQGKQTK